MKECLLCKAEKITPWLHEDNICWVAPCEKCKVPMVVWKRHGTCPTQEEQQHMIDMLTKSGSGIVDKKRRAIPEHWHAHLRPKQV